MPILSSIFLVISLWLAVLLGPQLSAWTWGASLLALGLAVVAALPGLWRQGGRAPGWWLGGVGLLVVGWFVVRALFSPLAEDRTMDLLLLGGVVGCFLVMRAMQESVAAERVFLWGLGLLLLASVVVTAWQVVDPLFSPGLVARCAEPSGFFGHYNYGAHFLIGASSLMGGSALFGSRYRQLERLCWGLIALGGIGVIFFTGSRGGQVGAAVATAMFVAMALIGGKRSGAKWFAPGIIALPFIGIVLIAFLLKGWSRSQEMRKADTGVDALLDNTIRLHLIGIAASCVTDHPWVGGGSRSFSWECNRYWEADTHGPGGNRPEQVHNEILQSAVDYGVIGAGLLLVWIGSVVVTGIVRSAFGERAGRVSNEDAWRVGGLAGLAGILAQSNFCFVFHVVPGALLLGVCLGRAVHPVEVKKALVSRAAVMGPMAALLGGAVAVLLIPMGWLGARVTAARWADGFGRLRDVVPEVRLQALNEAIKLWPLGEFFMDRGEVCQVLAAEQPKDAKEWMKQAIEDYASAARLNPFNPMPVVNRANLLSAAARDAEAEQDFEVAIRLQGGMEGTYKGGLSKAAHLRWKAERSLAEGKPDDALRDLLVARDTLEKACVFPSGFPHWGVAGTLRIRIAERLGSLLSAAGRDAEAEREFEMAAKIYTGAGIRYLYAYHCYLKGRRVWSERRPAEALSLFLKGRWLVDRATQPLPTGVTLEDQAKLRQELDKNIQFLKGARVEPSEPPPQ